MDLAGILQGSCCHEQEQDQTCCTALAGPCARCWSCSHPASSPLQALARRKGNLCCKRKKTMLRWNVPDLCCINFKQSVKVAQGAPRHTPSLRILRAKVVRVCSQGQSADSVQLWRRNAVPGTAGRRCSAIQSRKIPNSGPKLLDAASLLQEAGVMISVICGIQTNVLGSRLLWGELSIQILETLQLIFPSTTSFPLKSKRQCRKKKRREERKETSK